MDDRFTYIICHLSMDSIQTRLQQKVIHMKDELGDRMKLYEDAHRIKLPRGINTIIRVDGRAFHTYTRGCEKPYDFGLMEDMDRTAIALCEEIQGAKMAYVQSDEISIWVTDYDDVVTSAWFDNNLQKMASVSASVATTAFNSARLRRSFEEHLQDNPEMEYDTVLEGLEVTPAHFDSRVFTLPVIEEVSNYFKWRINDCSRNSVQMLARSLYSQRELEGKKTTELKKMCEARDQPWEKLQDACRHGRFILKFAEPATTVVRGETINFTRSSWKSDPVHKTTFTAIHDVIVANGPKDAR